MSSVLDISETTEVNLIPASQLRDMTVTPADIFNKQRVSLLESLMTDMVNVATNQGRSDYTAVLSSSFNPDLLNAIVSALEESGYKVANELKTNEGGTSQQSLLISW